ncbi:hypothetical protein KOAAANKH_03788 [Brevundimonas sp. NIBR10]|uniref:hypothetical protein n=1 Tax=Brevundimonas sp. NIBR10 TaxID=3015997 RepID=UPI0022F1DAD1|nr:hypothetical protein [Brevundimonas sp. NIBR10]WGM48874.1 hypothetical protein KOAAANKH_03788 [Brevundimonas sp. NIBR10]
MKTFAPVAAALVAASLFATSALACVPMPRDTAAEIAEARAVFVGRVTAVEAGDAAACRAYLARARIEPGMPGATACEAFGRATLEALHTVKGEVPAAPLIVNWNAHPVCYVGWTPAVGQAVLATVPADPRFIGEGANVAVDPQDQSDLMVRALLDLASKARLAR